ncbi:MAG: hypothetical protein U0360_00540 [Dehalococcoidia bacterium]
MIDANPSTPALASGVPRAPLTVRDTGLAPTVLIDLVAKAMFYRVRQTPGELGELLHLTRFVIEEVLAAMREEGQVEVAGPASALEYYFALTTRGRALAEDAFGRGRYVGPAPVAFNDYLATQAQQSVRLLHPTATQIRQQLAPLVLRSRIVDAIGAAVVSTGTVLLYGPSGNGKSTIAAAIRGMLPGAVAIPYAIDVSGQTIKFFDGRVHEPLHRGSNTAEPVSDESVRAMDGRYALCRRPLVVLSSELKLADLELAFSEADATYIAPPQMLANGGVLVVDDLGRQLVRPEELLNRWIGPIGTGWDHLVLRTGETLEVPFDSLLVFATNLDPHDLGDEAFERRIRHKALISSPTRDEFLEILRREAVVQRIEFVEEVAAEFVDAFYEDDSYLGEGRAPRGSHPGDILRNLMDFARFEGRPPEMTLERLHEAAEAFFVLDPT